MSPFTALASPPVAVGQGESWIELDGLIAVGDRSVEVALLCLGCSPVAVGQGESWIELDGLIAVRDRSVEIALPKLGICPELVGGGTLPIGLRVEWTFGSLLPERCDRNYRY
jgi:hypothetical protein